MTLGEPIFSLLSADELRAIRILKAMGCNPLRTSAFWEALVARITTGALTAHQCPWDVELATPWRGGNLRIEVKSSTEFMCRFRNGTRPVFKFGKPSGYLGSKTAQIDCTILIGLDANDDVQSWVVPASARLPVASITLTSPRCRIAANSRSNTMDMYACPPTQILPEVLGCHLNLDREHHMHNAWRTRREGKAVADLFA